MNSIKASENVQAKEKDLVPYTRKRFDVKKKLHVSITSKAKYFVL